MTLAPETTDLKVQLRLKESGSEGGEEVGEGWFTVCDLTHLLPGRGVAALLPDGRQSPCSATGRVSCTPSTTATRSAARPSSPAA